MKHIKLNVCQGVGDIFWVYQKFAPHVDTMEVSIAQVEKEGKIGTRAIEFLKLLPKITNIQTHQTSILNYKHLAESHFPITDVLSRINSGSFIDYGCNRPLENGYRIEDIDPGFEVETSVPIRTEYAPLAFEPGEFITVYISGTTLHKHVANDLSLWDVSTWGKFVKAFCRQYDLKKPIVIIGANYDKDAALQLENFLKKAGFQVHTYIDAWAANVNYILKNSYCYIGYQSGLNILADNFDTKQVMLYFPFLKKMLNTWCKLDNWKNGTFNASTFDMTPKQVLDGLRLRF